MLANHVLFLAYRQQYNVASKSVFVLTVELLDSSVLECTLSAESTGR
jgi:tyrosine-protein phosphatase non-receptor type 14/21